MLQLMGRRTASDEYYVIDICDELLGTAASRQHRFDWLRGDFSEKRRSYSYLPVDGYWETLGLVVEYAEHQHGESVTHFDKPHILTVSGVHRGIQRRIYDERRVDLIPKHGLALVVIPATAFTLKSNRVVRNRGQDAEIVRYYLDARYASPYQTK